MIHNSNSRNILIIHQHFCPPSGQGNNRSWEIAKNLSALGNRVTILTGTGNFDSQPRPLFSSQHIDGVQVDCIGVQYNHHMSYPKRLWSFMAFFFLACGRVWHYKKSTDVVYAISTPLSTGVVGLWFQKILNIPMLFEIGDLWPDVPIQMGILKNKFLIALLYKIEQRIYNKSNHIVLLSEGMKEYLLRKNISENKITILYNGTNIQQFSPAENKLALRAQYNISNDTFVLLYAGTIGLANGLEFFVNVAAEVERRKNSAIQFFFIGNGNRSAEIKSYVRSKKINNIVFIESMPKANIVDYFKLSNVGIVSFSPYKILETNSANKYYDYLASGLPVVINYQGWQKVALEKNVCGCSVSTVSEAADTLLNLSADVNLLKLMSANARVLAVQEYDRKEISERLHTLILQHS